MFFFAVLSGVVNLASQAVFMRVVSAANGDYYLTYYLTTLSFIVFSALGNLVAPKLRRWLPLVELGAGLYSLAIFAAIKHGMLLTISLPTPLAVALLIPPALALGVHIPLYTHFVKGRVGYVYGLYHLGAASGVISLEWLVLPYVPLSFALGVLGLTQASLGMLILAFFFINRKSLNFSKPTEIPFGLTWVGKHKLEIACVFIASVASYFSIAWGLKQFQYLLIPTRMHNGLFNGAVLLMVALGGIISTALRGKALSFISPIAGIGLLGGMLLFNNAPDIIFRADFWGVELFALTLSIFFATTALISSTIFSRITESLGENRDVAMGRMLFVSAIGNLAGAGLAITIGSELLSVWPEFFAVGILACVVTLWTASRENITIAFLCFVPTSLILAVAMSLDFSTMETVFALRAPFLKVEGNELSTELGSTAGYVYGKIKSDRLAPGDLGDIMMYFVDGHNSHNVLSEAEISVGLLAAKFQDVPFKRSMVIGMGSGQTAYGVSTISTKTDVVEISPAVMSALPMFERYNHRVWSRPDVTINRTDGLNFVRNCQPASYDYIFNTSTYPVMFNAYKLYTDEFVIAAKRCLKPGGILQFYFDDNSGGTVEQIRTILAPLAKHFKHIGITPSPYPNVFVSDRDLIPSNMVDLNKMVQRPDDRAILRKSSKALDVLACSGWHVPTSIMPSLSQKLSTLDEPLIERISVVQRMRYLTHLADPKNSQVGRLFRDFNPSMTSSICSDGVVSPTAIDPLKLNLHAPHEKATKPEVVAPHQVNLTQDVRTSPDGVVVVTSSSVSHANASQPDGADKPVAIPPFVTNPPGQKQPPLPDFSKIRNGGKGGQIVIEH